MINAVDLFCGAGGLTKGLEKAGIKVNLGVDIDPTCKFPYEANNKAKFLMKSVDEISGDEIFNFTKRGKKSYTLLAGCAPCQPFSSYRKGIRSSSDKRWKLLKEFKRLVEESSPDFITMENVPRLCEERVFKDFVKSLINQGYFITYSVVNCADYGVPQQRKRLVLMASILGPIGLIPPTHKTKEYVTVEKVLSKLPKIKAGQTDKYDRLHCSSSLSELNLIRIKSSKPGGTWRDWNKKLIADCHKKKTGKTYPSVYGRMSWDQPSPTITTQFFGFGNGRFGHPEQNRAISIREGAILQSFPRSYKFVRDKEEVNLRHLGRLIGNAVPVKLGQVIGKSFLAHLNEFKKVKR